MPANSPASGALDAETDIVAALGDRRLALGDPDHVPAGIYARQALEALGLWPELENRLIRAADVRVHGRRGRLRRLDNSRRVV